MEFLVFLLLTGIAVFIAVVIDKNIDKIGDILEQSTNLEEGMDHLKFEDGLADPSLDFTYGQEL